MTEKFSTKKFSRRPLNGHCEGVTKIAYDSGRLGGGSQWQRDELFSLRKKFAPNCKKSAPLLAGFMTKLHFPCYAPLSESARTLQQTARSIFTDPSGTSEPPNLECRTHAQLGGKRNSDRGPRAEEISERAPGDAQRVQVGQRRSGGARGIGAVRRNVAALRLRGWYR